MGVFSHTSYTLSVQLRPEWTCAVRPAAVSPHSSAYYNIPMTEMINGRPVTEDQIAEWAAEAEAGYDVEKLRRRGRGRPGRGAQPSQVVAVRLTPDELAEVDEKAAAAHKTRSAYIRGVLLPESA